MPNAVLGTQAANKLARPPALTGGVWYRLKDGPSNEPRLLVFAPHVVPSQTGYMRAELCDQQDTAEMTKLPPYCRGHLL